MAAGEILIKHEVRPCFVNNEKALFHQWITKTDICGHKYSAGLVEFEDGITNEVHHSKIIFCDNKLKEYAFDELKGGEK